FWNLVVFILLLIFRRYNPIRGEVFLSYIMLYSIGRFVIEGMRMDSLYIGELRIAQIISVLLIVGAISLIVYRRGVIKDKYNDKNVINKQMKK
ncbi:MAG TPA: prolipoprotein diacylglyceryl transferase family protein, partial [Pseudogracilibacillus sp.]|nr:prolipoprotein diacylglyceryl transferase family protein [Pseudogracilibacillus sp.]